MATEDMSEDLTASSSDAELDMDFEEVGCDGLSCASVYMTVAKMFVQFQISIH